MSTEGWIPPGSDSGEQARPTPPAPVSPAPTNYPAQHPQPPAPPQPPAQQPPAQPQPPAQQTQPVPHAPQPPPGGQPQWQQMVFQPGIIPLRPLDLGAIYGGVFRTIRGNVAATVGLAALTSTVFIVPFTALGAWTSTTALNSIESAPDDVNPEDIGGLFGSFLTQIGSWLSTVLLVGFMAWVIGQAVQGRKVTMGQTWRGTRGRIPALFGATILTTLIYVLVAAVLAIPAVAASLGFVRDIDISTADSMTSLMSLLGIWFLYAVVLIVPLFFLWVRLAFVNAAVVLENAGPVTGLRRSWSLTRSGFWRLAGIRILTAFGVMFIGIALTVPLSALSFAAAALPPDQLILANAVAGGLSAILIGAITAPLSAGVDALLYVDQRIRLEGLDMQLIAASQGAPDTPAWSTPTP